MEPRLKTSPACRKATTPDCILDFLPDTVVAPLMSYFLRLKSFLEQHIVSSSTRPALVPVAVINPYRRRRPS